MKYVWECRRTFISVLGILCLLALGLVQDMDVATAIATVAVGVAAANAGEAAFKKREEPKDAE